jgi:O-methyltransferase
LASAARAILSDPEEITVMFGKVLTAALRSLLQRRDDVATPGERFPAEELRALKALHERCPLDMHARILFGGARIEDTGLLDLFNACVNESATTVSPWKTLARIQGAMNLAHYFLHSLSLEGARAECGVFRGLSALYVCRTAALKRKEFTGADFHLVDSFEGFPEPRSEDFITVNRGKHGTARAPAFQQGDAAASLEHVRRVLRDFPGVHFHQGFIPQVLSGLPETHWAFVHIDVDLHQPTLESLEYFYPRMIKGGIVICDDYGSELFPGARKAWDQYCNGHDIPFVVLGTGQSVIVR